MGTRGYSALRHKGRYFVYYSCMDSHPQCLGLGVWGSVPQDPRRLKKWLALERRRLDRILLKLGDHVYVEGKDDEGDEVEIMREPPCKDTFIEWIWTIDLDNLVFHVDSNPVFSLTNLPRTENEFLQYIGANSYGHRSYSSDTPLEYQFCAHWSDEPPDVDENILKEYSLLSAKECAAADVLNFPESSVSGIRRKYVESFIGAVMYSVDAYQDYLLFLQTSGREDMSTRVLELAMKLLCVVLAPPMFSTERKPSVNPFKLLRKSGLRLPRDEKELLWWMRDNLCIYISTHLDDPDNFQASVVGIVKEMQAHDAEDTSQPKFGVIFAITKCAVVRLDNATNKVIHSPVLDFLPSWHATSPHTEGITLLARLCEYLDDLAGGCPSINPPPQDGQLRLPLELVSQILKCVPESESIINSARASPIFKAILKPILMHPYSDGHFLMAIGDDIKPGLILTNFISWDGQTERFPPRRRVDLYDHADYLIDALRGT